MIRISFKLQFFYLTKAMLGISALVNILGFCFFIKKLTRKCTRVDVEMGEEIQPAPIGLAPQVVVANDGAEDDEGIDDLSNPSTPPEVNQLRILILSLTFLMMKIHFFSWRMSISKMRRSMLMNLPFTTCKVYATLLIRNKNGCTYI